MQPKRGNFSTRGTFSRQCQQPTRPTIQRQTGNTVGPTGAATNQDLMPIGGFQSNAGRGRGRPTPSRGAPGTHAYVSNRGTQQNIQSQRNINTSGAANQITNQCGQGRQTQNIRGRPLGRGNTQLYNNCQDNAQDTSFDIQRIATNMYQTGPYGDMNMFGQVPWDHGQNVPTNFSNNNNNRMVTPYTNTQTNYSNNFYPQRVSNQPFNIFGGNAEFQSQNMMANDRGGMRQTPLRGGYQGNMNMMPTHSWMNETSYMINSWNNSSPRDTDGFNNNVTMDTNLTQAVTTNEPPAKLKKSPAKTAIGELQKSLHLLTGDIEKIKHWSIFKDSIHMMFQFYGQLDSAVSRGDGTSKDFLIKDEKNNTVKCVFYEIDRLIPKLTRGQWYRIVGTYDTSKEHITCLSVRQMLPGETNLMYVLSNKSSEIMKKLTIPIREL